jgi:hypothetical protein
MATLTITINSALGNTTKTLTFSSPDAQRIMDAFQNHVPNGTQQQLTDEISRIAKDYLGGIVIRKEVVYPTAPVMT